MGYEAAGWDLSAVRDESVLKAVRTQDILTYTNRHQATVAKWVYLRPIL